MPARVRKTVPYSGNLPHREHRSRRGRCEDYRIKRNAAVGYAMKEKKAKKRVKQKLRKMAATWDR